MHAPQVELGDVGFTEGPAVTADGRLFCTSLTDGTVVEARDGTVLARHRIGGGPTGTAVAADGTVYVVQCSGLFGAPSDTAAGLYAIEDGAVRTVHTDTLRAPNDICFGPDGALYFTDPAADPTAPAGPVPAPVCAYDLRTGELRVLADGIRFPNGLAFSPADDALLVAESLTGRVLRYAWAPGELGPPTVAIQIDDGPPDGMCFDADGNLFVAVPDADAVEVFDPAGTEIDRIPCGERSFPTNCCFGGPERDILYITVAKAGGVLRVQPGTRGLPLHQ